MTSAASACRRAAALSKRALAVRAKMEENRFHDGEGL